MESPAHLLNAWRATRLLRALPRLAIVLVLISLATMQPAAGQDPEPTGSLELLGQTPWVTNGAPFSLQMRANSILQPPEIDIVVTVFAALPNRSAYLRSLEDNISGPSTILERRPLVEVLGEDGVARVDLPVQDPAQRRYFLRQAGVYPVRVDIRETGTDRVMDRVVTHLINQPVAPSVTTRLNVSTVLPVQARLSDDDQAPKALPDDGRNAQVLSEVLTKHPLFPAFLAVQPESVERLQGDGEAGRSALTNLVTSRAARPVAATTWTAVTPPLFGSGLSDEVRHQFDRAERVMNTDFPDRETRTWIATDSIDTTAATELKARGFARMVVREADLSAQQRDTTLARPFVVSLSRNKGTMPAAQADRALSDHFGDPEGPVVGAHRLLADLAVLYNDRPGQSRGVIVMPPRTWSPNSTFMEIFLTGLETSPMLAPSTIDQVFDLPPETAGKTTLSRQLITPPKAQTSGFPSDRIKDVRKRLNGFSSLVAPENEERDVFEAQLLYAEGADLDHDERSDRLDALEAGINGQLDAIRMPSERSIRLTAREGEIPVSVQNNTGYPVRVVIRLESDKLVFPDGNTRTVDVEREFVTERFAVDARTSGSFPVTVRLESPDGSITLEQSRITVRSTAASAIGLILSVGAGVFLILWWVRSMLKARHNRPPTDTPSPAEAAGTSV